MDQSSDTIWILYTFAEFTHKSKCKLVENQWLPFPCIYPSISIISIYLSIYLSIYHIISIYLSIHIRFDILLPLMQTTRKWIHIRKIPSKWNWHWMELEASQLNLLGVDRRGTRLSDTSKSSTSKPDSLRSFRSFFHRDSKGGVRMKRFDFAIRSQD
jgi:hypothetical protein